MTDTTREAFELEARCRSLDIERFEGGYSDSETNCGWTFWQAATLAAAPQWLPIADAPRDGRILDIFIQPLAHQIVKGFLPMIVRGQFIEGLAFEPTPKTDLGPWNSQNATHYMPLPLPPTATPQGKP